MMSFFVSVTCICAAMAVIGMVFEPDVRFGYEAFLSPILFGAIASFPLLVKYSKNELSVKQAIIRNILHFVLLEVLILSVLLFEGLLTGLSMAVSLAVSIFIIYLTVNLFLWVNDKKAAADFNNALKKLQIENNSGD